MLPVLICFILKQNVAHGFTVIPCPSCAETAQIFRIMGLKNQRPSNVAKAKIGSGGHQADSLSVSTLANRGLAVEGRASAKQAFA